MRWYYQVIRRNLSLIIGGTLLVGLIALIVTLFLPKEYEAQAGVAILKSRSDVTLDPRFETLSEDEIVRYAGSVDFNTRRQTLIALAQSTAVIDLTVAELDNDWTIKDFNDKASIIPAGNLLELRVSTDDEEVAAEAANTWARIFTEYTNVSYGQSESSGNAIDDQLASALETYETAQLAYEEYLANNEADEINFAINARDDLVRAVRQSYITAQTAALEVSTIAETRLPLLIENAKALQRRVGRSSGEADLATEVAAFLLEVSSLSTGATVPLGLQLELPGITNSSEGTTKEELSKTVENLIVSLTEYQESLVLTNIQSSLNIINEPDLDSEVANQIAVLQNEIDVLRSQAEVELTNKRELVNERELAWDTYKLLQRKSTELVIAEGSAETEVIFITPTVPPSAPVGPSVLLNTAVGLALGLIGTMLFAFLRAHLQEE